MCAIRLGYEIELGAWSGVVVCYASVCRKLGVVLLVEGWKWGCE